MTASACAAAATTSIPAAALSAASEAISEQPPGTPAAHLARAAIEAVAPIIRQLQALNDEIAVSDRAIIELVKTDANARRLMSVPGIGPITASAIAASVQDVGPSLAHESSQRSSDWRRDRTRLAVRSASDACQKWETDISARPSAPMLSSSTERPIRMG